MVPGSGTGETFDVTTSPEVDCASIEQQTKVIRTALGRIKTIKTKLTELGSCTSAIDEQAEHLRGEVKEALCLMEDSLRAGLAKPPAGVAPIEAVIVS